MPRLENLNPKSRDFKSRLGGCETCVINDKLFSRKDHEDQEMTLSLILRFNLRLGGYSIWSASIAHHIRRRDSGLEHLIALSHPKKYSEDYSKLSTNSRSKQWVPEALTNTR